MAVAKDLWVDQQTAVDPENPSANEEFTAAKANAVRDKVYEVIDEFTLYALASHLHDDRYFTETEINAFFEGESSGKKQVHWDRITNKPSTFAPSAHTHTESQITDLDKYTQAEIDAFFEGESSGKKQVHWDRITNKPSTFAPSAHTHTLDDITDFTVNYGMINIKDYGAVGDGVANDTTAFNDAQDAAVAANKRLFLPAGTYKVVGSANALHGHTFYHVKVPIVGAGKNASTIFYSNGTGDNRGLFIGPALSAKRPQRLGINITPGQTREAVDDQGFGLNTVTCSTPANAANFSVGDYVTVSCGKNIYDADDPLWAFSEIFKIIAINAGTGVITLDRNIKAALNSGGFEGQTIDAWTNADNTVTAGDWRDTGDSGPVYEALTTGTTNGTSPLDDIGVSWKLVCNARGSLTESEEDYSPCIQLILGPVKDVILEDLTIQNESELIYPYTFRYCINSGLKRVKIKGQVAIAMNGAESVTNFVYDDVELDVTQHSSVAGDSHARSGSFFAAKGTIKNVIQAISGKGTDSRGIMGESYCDLNIENCKFYNRVPGVANSYGIFSEGSIWRLVNNEFWNFNLPIRRNITAESGFSDHSIDPYRRPIASFVEVRGNVFGGMSSEGFRTTGGDVRKVYNASNSYPGLRSLYQSGNIQYPDQVDFYPYKQGILSFEFTPLESAGGETDDENWYNIADSNGYVWIDGEPVLLDSVDLVILGQSVYYNNAPSSTSVNVRIRGHNNTTIHWFFSTTSSANGVLVSDTAPSNEIFDGAGGTSRYFSSQYEDLQYLYYLDGTDGGSVMVMLHVLVASKK